MGPGGPHEHIATRLGQAHEHRVSHRRTGVLRLGDFLKVELDLPDAVIAAQMGWSEQAVAEMVATYAHAVDERRLDELARAFETQTRRTTPANPLAER